MTEKKWRASFEEKHCVYCQTTKSKRDFYQDERMKDGYMNKCIECTLARANYLRKKKINIPIQVKLHEGLIPFEFLMKTKLFNSHREPVQVDKFQLLIRWW